ncbi:MAG TPA: aminopeptidase P family protein [Actinobacteria bacterium]|nr:aminopeptidase P family protein [Actinomycetota bacterium]
MSPDSNRLHKLDKLFDDQTPAILVSQIANIRYLLNKPTMFDPSFGGVMLVAPGVAILMVDSRYLAQTNEADLACEIRSISESPWVTAAGAIKEANLKRVGFEANEISVSQWEELKTHTTAELRPAKNFVERPRLIKESTEIDHLSKAAAIGDDVFSEILTIIKPGLREADIATEIDYRMKKAGAERPSFDTIVASGPNSAFPHAGAGQRRVQAGDFIKLDFGAQYLGYHSDMTRTVVLGQVSTDHRQAYDAVARSQQLVLDQLKPGMTGAEADAIARDFFESIGMADRFGHNLGHGLGLQVHEGPSLGWKSKNVLAQGMVFTVEPGLYLPGFGGVRIEDAVVMRENGVEILTRSSKELIEIV